MSISKFFFRVRRFLNARGCEYVANGSQRYEC